MIKLDENQRQAVNRMKNGNILCGGVGSGKSITALAYYYTKVCGGFINGLNEISSNDYIYLDIEKPVDLYIITTAKKRDSKEWELEMAPFLLSPDPKYCKYGMKVVIDSWNNISKYTKVENAFFIFDEQRVVGKGAWSKSFIKITKNNQWILCTATPGDKWEDYIPVFIANGFYKSRKEFIERHVVYDPFVSYRKIDRYVETKRLERLRNEIIIFMKYDKKTHSNAEFIQVEYNRKKYKTMFKKRWNVYEDAPIESASELCYLLRKCVNEDDSRATRVTELIQEKEKVIIFYNFDYELEILHRVCEFLGVEYAEWNGHKHEALPEGERWVYLVQYTAGAEGWNCITTNVIIFYSLNYSYKTTVQAAGRIDRRNTPFEELYYYYLYSSSPIDLAIRRALKNKKNFNERAFISSKK